MFTTVSCPYTYFLPWSRFVLFLIQDIPIVDAAVPHPANESDIVCVARFICWIHKTYAIFVVRAVYQGAWTVCVFSQKSLPLLERWILDIDVLMPSACSSDTFIKNPDGSEYIGKVWPGYTVSHRSLRSLLHYTNIILPSRRSTQIGLQTPPNSGGPKRSKTGAWTTG